VIGEFKKFAMRGNVVDLAVGVVIGAAFGKIVAAMVDGLIMPLLGLVIGTVDVSVLGLTLREASGDRPALILKYGAFLQATIDFVLIAFAIFLLMKGLNRLHLHKEADAPKGPPEDVVVLREIRDLLRDGAAKR
jgi:large conductance mechanosensitive channel